MKIYRIRNKVSGKFISLGYNSKSRWSDYPTSVIMNNRHRLRPLSDYEVVIFECIEVEKESLEIKIKNI